jgi:hypothetical protein
MPLYPPPSGSSEITTPLDNGPTLDSNGTAIRPVGLAVRTDGAGTTDLYGARVVLETEFGIPSGQNAASFPTDLGNPNDVMLLRAGTEPTKVLAKSVARYALASSSQVSGSPIQTFTTVFRHRLAVGDVVELIPGGAHWNNWPGTKHYRVTVATVPTSKSFTVVQPSNANATGTSTFVGATNYVLCRHKPQTVEILARYSVGTARTIVTAHPHGIVPAEFQKIDLVDMGANYNFTNGSANSGSLDGKTFGYIGATSVDEGSRVATIPSPATSGTTLIVTAGHGTRFPATPFKALVWAGPGTQPNQASGGNAEIVNVTNISTDTLTIVRAQDGSTARSIALNDYVMPIESNGFVSLGWYPDGGTSTAAPQEQSPGGVTNPATAGRLRIPMFPRPVINGVSGGHAVVPESEPSIAGWTVGGVLTYTAGSPPTLAPTATSAQSFGTGGFGVSTEGEQPLNSIAIRIHTLPTEATGIIFAGWSSGSFGVQVNIDKDGYLKIVAPYTNKVLAASPIGTVVAGDYVVVERIGRRIVTSVWTADPTTIHTKKANGSLEALALMLNDYGVTAATWTRPTIGFFLTTTAKIYAGRSVTQFIQDSWGRVYV